jgi:sulfite exporter TauE/SafE
MCGGIAMLLGLPAHKSGGAQLLSDQVSRHGGRILSYMLLGGLAGGAGQVAFGGLDAVTGHLVLRWAAGLSLGWIGLSLAGLMPVPAFATRHLFPHMPGVGTVMAVPAPLRNLAGGMVWGFFPCAMVYGALLYALFTGSAVRGGIVMLGFGLGTLPSLVAAGLGLPMLHRIGRARIGMRAIGGLIALSGAASLILPEHGLGRFCVTVARNFSF